MGKKVVITDQYENIDAERRIIGAHGHELYDYQIRDAGALIPVCRDADAIVTQYSDVSAELIDSLEHCAMIIKYGIGVNNIDVEAATRKGIYVCNVPDYGVEEVSDHAVAMMLALSKKLPVLTRALREGDWGYGSTVPLSRFCESTVGLVGFGRIPQLVAKKLKGFGVAIRVGAPSTAGAGIRGGAVGAGRAFGGERFYLRPRAADQRDEGDDRGGGILPHEAHGRCDQHGPGRCDRREGPGGSP